MPPSSATPPPPQSLKQRVLICLTKLSDRDTYALAVTELDSIARSLDPSSFPVFLSCIQSTDTADKSPVRKQCVNLLATLSLTYGNTLSPYIAKMLTTVTRRLRDPDSAVRSACVNTASTIASHVTKPSFESFVKAFADALFTEQDVNAQMGAALCLASAIDSAPNPEPAKLGRLLPRFEKLLKSDGFKAKAGVLTLIGSVVGVGGAGSVGALKNLMPCVMGFLISEDWAARKAAAEVLLKLAVVERDLLAEYKTGCMKVFENRRFDKVKVVREVMNQMLEAWKQVPDISEEISPLKHSISSSKENASDGKYTTGARNVSSAGAQMRKKHPSARSTPPDSSYTTPARKRSPLMNSDRNSAPASIRKVDQKKPSNWKVEIAVSNCSLPRGTGEDDPREGNENIPDRSNGDIYGASKPETRRALFSKNSDERVHKLGGFRSGSRVAPCNEESSESNTIQDHHRNHKDSEDLSSIRNQLVQIEKQQSSLLDLLQKFMGSSQSGLRSLETRVHGLELALDEISYDLAVTSGRMTQTDSSATTCCMLPSDFLSSRFWRKHNTQSLSSRLTASTRTPAAAGMRFRADRSDAELYGLENCRFQHRGGAGFIVNPLAKIHSDSRTISDTA
ncbi:TORTIFOLIA1-like protein 3 [Punica granatum]|uniref:TORTIFOLIA1-like protein 3 n=1 Tax=Punica granatum TaxID=22663 RepID=A0A218XZM9_PUNGR|nr:TORTIFOLIA1-like protein 3 [Punica granatum]OWM90463.1 hypothetical protein CDL15_Pgr014766 [Punica granatum]